MSSFNSRASFKGQHRALYALSEILITSVKKMLAQKGDIYLSEDPKVTEKEIVEFSRRMRVDGLEKFPCRTIMASVNFYIDKSHMASEQALGAMVVYLPEDYIARLMWLLEYGRINENDDMELLDACGTLTNLIAGGFVKELCANGFVHLEMSHFETFVNSPVNGIIFSPKETVKHEIEFYIRKEKRMVLELSMGHLQRY
jgi:hypothetical protein